MSRPHYVRVENGENAPSLPAAFRVAKVLGTTVDDLFARQYASNVDPAAGSGQVLCPVCGSDVLRVTDRGRVQVWTCAACGHTWRTRTLATAPDDGGTA